MTRRATEGTLQSMTVALIGSPTKTNVLLTYVWRALGVDARILWPSEALALLVPGDAAITRLDVLPTLDGVEPGLELVGELGRQGVRVINSPDGLMGAHDKLLTARRLAAAGIPHPWTIHVDRHGPFPAVPLPCVVKPRFGSWGQDVVLCRSLEDVTRSLESVSQRSWWARNGALVQALVEPVDHDVRVVVAGDRAVAGAQRMAAEGEWRTNVTLGGRVVRAELPPGTEELAVRAARAVGIDFCGVDLLPAPDGWTVLELNGAVDYDSRYALPGTDPFAAILDELGIPVPVHGTARTGTLEERREEVAVTKTIQGETPRPGDEIVITGHAVGSAPRTAVILEVLGDPGHERFRVRWEDDHESIYFPGEDAVIRRPAKRAKGTAATKTGSAKKKSAAKAT
jgi:tetrahydromethanopterin:alpha-L-glutamate ligase